jgi:hypothetical protein
MEEISNWNYARLSRFSPDGFQKENGLCAKFGADPSAADADEEGVEGHEPFDKCVFHCVQSKR